MDQLKSFLRGDIDWVDPSIIKKLQQYDTIQVATRLLQATIEKMGRIIYKMNARVVR